MNLRNFIRWLLPPALLLPMLVAVLFGLMGLLSAIEDTGGEQVVRTIGVLLLTLWIVNIAALAIAASLELLSQDEKNEL